MSDFVIEVSKLSKIFRLYANMRARVLDSVGFGVAKGRAYKEKAALRDVSFSIARGERVAIIGSNGAGKSTLLKILTGVLLPTGGEIVVRGQTRALLQIGAGFHPELTGRENVRQYLAHFGLPEVELEQRVGEIVEFAEIAEYIDQPVKTYSTGMGMRLMFAASTLFSPEILIIDEVLGVGDSYFAQKSFERIRAMCTDKNTTLLLVTHNIYDAERLCDRAIWIDGGRVERDGEIKSVLAAYEARARDRAIASASLARSLPVAARADDEALEGGLYWSAEHPAGERLMIGGVKLRRGDTVLAELDLADANAISGFHTSFSPDEGWGELENWNNRLARPFRRFGPLRHRLPLLMPPGIPLDGAEPVTLSVTYWADHPTGLRLDLASPGRKFTASALLDLPVKGQWAEARADIHPDRNRTEMPDDDRFGTRDIEICDVRFGDNGNNDGLVDVGSQLAINLSYRINRPDFDEKPLLLFTVSLDGHNICYIWNDQVPVRMSNGREGIVTVKADPLLLGAGEYRITCSIYREGWLGPEAGTVYFAADHGLYDMLRRRFTLTVRGRSGGPNMVRDFVFQQPSLWSAPGGDHVQAPFIIGRDG